MLSAQTVTRIPTNQPHTTHKMPTPPPPSQHLPVQTHHCRFCNHLLLATTRSIPSLPRRKEPSKDNALILPLPLDTTSTSTTATTTTTTNDNSPDNQTQKHYTILLSTTIPDRKPTLIRREDGFEKRLFLRCGRCRVVVGYFLDPVHFPELSGEKNKRARGEDEEDGVTEGEDEKARVVYLLPGALTETGVMMEENDEKVRGLDREWIGWLEGN
ncbi:hypothetical protein BO78DRAFT_458988 [Aspergillus sclerotiicarbonarius CBS 121057]|uniref:STEEP1 domain-containing protein n=1 Tax=Aspergillus sclerotiicarbonarius (strain CBS 121057 / IBT 28362) TaxID=1448318 RepID=A0A319ES83_ASPSB|nr:hypothetical protein BO78DRAFT_458988 [Aspergillus sclerotiicarbonarius CBS 121057]